MTLILKLIVWWTRTDRLDRSRVRRRIIPKLRALRLEDAIWWLPEKDELDLWAMNCACDRQLADGFKHLSKDILNLREQFMLENGRTPTILCINHLRVPLLKIPMLPWERPVDLTGRIFGMEVHPLVGGSYLDLRVE